MDKKERRFTFTEKMNTPGLNDLVRAILEDGPTEAEQSILCVLAIMDETYQDILASDEVDDALKKVVLFMYDTIEQYLDLEDLGH